MKTRLAPDKIALWRFEQIEEALEPTLSKVQRARIIKRKSKVPVCWPSGETKSISRASLYRWLDAYGKDGLAALQSKPRRDRGRKRAELPKEVVVTALRLLSHDPGLTLTLLLGVLRAMFEGIFISRSTLQRRLSEHEAYKRLKRAQRHGKRRGRFSARKPHGIWQCDAKGPVCVRLVNGTSLKFHVLSILDDATRAILAALIVLSPNLAACVQVFRQAALRWGLPVKYYADRASVFDAVSFRAGLAALGVHRIRSKPYAKEARGKIEAYHRTLVMWFSDRLKAQRVVDQVHLQQLLDGFVWFYQDHYHRSLKKTPKEAFMDKTSGRQVPPSRLYEVFRQDKWLRTHRKTGEVELQRVTYLVPDELRGQRLKFLLDPPAEIEPVVVHPESDRHLPLRRASIKPEDLPPEEPEVERHQAGPLQAIYDSYNGKRRPQAEPGFGLPELYALLIKLSGRHVPVSDEEAALVQRLYQQHGPWKKEATEYAVRRIGTNLGAARPLRTYLDALIARVVHVDPPT